MIYFLGDVHGQFDHVLKFSLTARPDAVIFLGDIEARRPFLHEIAPLLDAGIDVRWIRGNHDTDTSTSWGHLADAMHLNIDGKVVDLYGVRIAGLGGVFRREIWLPDPANPSGATPCFASYDTYVKALKNTASVGTISVNSDHDSMSFPSELICTHRTKALTHKSSIFWNTYESLWERSADILVTHEAPSCHPCGFTVIDELAQAMGVSKLFHGHHHDSLDYRTSDKRLNFRAFGVGLCGITDQTGHKIRAGNLDEARSHRSRRTGYQ